MSVLFSGMIHVTGAGDSGKTSFALECGIKPSQIAFLENDIKGKTIVDQLIKLNSPFGIYHNLVEETKGMREIDYHNYRMKIINDEILTNPNIETVIFDTWSQFESTFHPVVAKNPSKYKEFYSPMGIIKAGEIWLKHKGMNPK